MDSTVASFWTADPIESGLCCFAGSAAGALFHYLSPRFSPGMILIGVASLLFDKFCQWRRTHDASINTNANANAPATAAALGIVAGALCHSIAPRYCVLALVGVGTLLSPLIFMIFMWFIID